jgi:hypothetical protein
MADGGLASNARFPHRLASLASPCHCPLSIALFALRVVGEVSSSFSHVVSSSSSISILEDAVYAIEYTASSILTFFSNPCFHFSYYFLRVFLLLRPVIRLSLAPSTCTTFSHNTNAVAADGMGG